MDCTLPQVALLPVPVVPPLARRAQGRPVPKVWTALAKIPAIGIEALSLTDSPTKAATSHAAKELA